MVGQPRKVHGGAANGGSAKGNPRWCGKWWVSQGKSTAVQQMVVQVRNAHVVRQMVVQPKNAHGGAANGGAGKESPRRCSKWWCR